MQLINSRSFEELVEESTKELASAGFNNTPGSIARLFMNIINQKIANLYNTLTVNHLRAFVTTSYGAALDAIGALVQCFRLEKETDDNYRYRITRQCLTLATSNETAVKLTTLTVNGVKDVVLKPYSMGAGSFTVIIITDDYEKRESVIKEVNNKLLSVHGYGIRYNVISPTLNYIRIKHKIELKDSVPNNKKQDIKYEVRKALSEYLNNLKIGEQIITDKITQVIMNVSSEIIEESNIELFINDERALYVNQQSRWFERFILSKEDDNVIIV